MIKTFSFLPLCLSLTFVLSSTAHAKIPIPVTQDSPDSIKSADTGKDDQGKSIKLGWLYKEWGFIFTPVWTKDEGYVLYEAAPGIRGENKK